MLRASRYSGSPRYRVLSLFPSDHEGRRHVNIERFSKSDGLPLAYPLPVAEGGIRTHSFGLLSAPPQHHNGKFEHGRGNYRAPSNATDNQPTNQ